MIKRNKKHLLDAGKSLRNYYEEGKEETEIAKIGSFIQCGLFVLSVILISGIAIAYGQNKLQKDSIPTTASTDTVTTTAQGYSKSEKKLPIYCVDTTEKKVALSFDAAWGKRRLM